MGAIGSEMALQDVTQPGLARLAWEQEAPVQIRASRPM